MTNTFLAHFFLVDEHFLSSLAGRGYELKALSIPSFAKSNNSLEAVHRFYPNCFIFDIAEWLGVSTNTFIPTAEFLDATTKYSLLHQSLRMHVFDKLNFYERSIKIDLISRLAVYFLQSQKIELVVFGGCPHSVADSCLMAAAKYLKIKVFFLQDKPIAPYSSFVYNSDYQLIDASSISQNRKDLDKLTHKILSEYQKTGSLFLDTKQKDDTTPWKKIYQKDSETIGQKLEKLTSSEEDSLLLKEANEYLRKWNSIACSDVNSVATDNKAVSLYLHVEPEAAVNPFAGPDNIFQIHTIRKLREKVDKSIPLFIKEHPAMFLCSYKRKNVYSEYRPDSMLEEVFKLPNTYLIHTDFNSDHLMNLTACGATLSGSVLHEYVLQKKPVLTHQSHHAFFSEGSYDMSSNLTINYDLLDDWQNKLKTKNELELIRSWLQPSVPGSPNANLNMFRGLESEKEKIENSLSLGNTIHQVSQNLLA